MGSVTSEDMSYHLNESMQSRLCMAKEYAIYQAAEGPFKEFPALLSLLHRDWPSSAPGFKYNRIYPVSNHINLFFSTCMQPFNCEFIPSIAYSSLRLHEAVHGLEAQCLITPRSPAGSQLTSKHLQINLSLTRHPSEHCTCITTTDLKPSKAGLLYSNNNRHSWDWVPE